MKKFRITEIKNAIEPLFGIAFEKMRSRVWQEVDSPLYTILYYEDLGDTNAMFFDGFINLSTNRIVIKHNNLPHYFALMPGNFDSTAKVIAEMISTLSRIMKNRYIAIMRERKLNAILGSDLS